MLTYSHFINEGWFNKKKETSNSSLCNKIIKFADIIDPASMKITSNMFYDWIEFTITNVNPLSTNIDPYGEDFADVIKTEIRISKETTDRYTLFIDDEKISESNKDVKKIFEIYYNKYITLKTEEICRILNIDDLYEGLFDIFNSIDPSQIQVTAFKKYYVTIKGITIELEIKTGIISDYVDLTIDYTRFYNIKENKLFNLYKILEKRCMKY